MSNLSRKYLVRWDNNLGKGECLCNSLGAAHDKARSMLGSFRRLTEDELLARRKKGGKHESSC